MTRVLLQSKYAEFEPGVTIDLEDEKAQALVKRAKAVLATEQTVYNHEDEMPEDVKKRAYREVEAATAAGDYRNVAARTAATAALKK